MTPRHVAGRAHTVGGVLCAALLSSACGRPAPTVQSIEEARRRVVGPPASFDLGAASVVVPLVGPETKPLVEVRLNGRGPYRLLVDTGANVTLLQGRVARELELRILRPGKESQLVEVDRLEIGHARFDGVVAGARDWREDIDGVLGFNLFSGCLLTFDYPARTLVLERGALPSANGVDRIPFEVGERGHPFFDLQIGDSRMRFLLDTGAAQWLTIPKAMAKDLRFDGPPRPGPTLTWNDQSYPVEAARLADDVRIGGYILRRPEVFLTPEEHPLVGSGFLKEFRLTIDQGSKVVRLARDSAEPIQGP